MSAKTALQADEAAPLVAVPSTLKLDLIQLVHLKGRLVNDPVVREAAKLISAHWTKYSVDDAAAMIVRRHSIALIIDAPTNDLCPRRSLSEASGGREVVVVAHGYLDLCGDVSSAHPTNTTTTTQSSDAIPVNAAVSTVPCVGLLSSSVSIAATASFIVVHHDYRGRTVGAILMRSLEQLALTELNCYYMTLSTTTDAAARFYQRLGYREGFISQRVSQRRCFQVSSFSQDGLDRLQSLLLKKQQATTSAATAVACASPLGGVAEESTDSSNDTGRPKDVRYFVKLLAEERNGGFVSIRKDILHGIELANRTHGGMHSDGGYRHMGGEEIPEIPWQLQIGPSCGLSIIRMVREFYYPSATTGFGLSGGGGVVSQLHQPPSLLELARSLDVTEDGEVFSTAKLLFLLQTYFRMIVGDGEAQRRVVAILKKFGTFEEFETILDETIIVNKASFAAIAYDRDPGTDSASCVSGGMHAHWGIILTSSLRLSNEETSVAAPEVLHCVIQQSASRRPCVCTRRLLFESNSSLRSLTTVNSSGQEVSHDLAELRGSMIIVRAA